MPVGSLYLEESHIGIGLSRIGQEESARKGHVIVNAKYDSQHQATLRGSKRTVHKEDLTFRKHVQPKLAGQDYLHIWMVYTEHGELPVFVC